MNDDWANVDMESYRESTKLRKKINDLERIAKSAIKYIEGLGETHLADALTLEHRQWWQEEKRREQNSL